MTRRTDGVGSQLLTTIQGFGVDAFDLWTSHLNPAWATHEHVEVATELLAAHGLRVASLAGPFGANRREFERTCGLAIAPGRPVLGGSTTAWTTDRDWIIDALEWHDLRLAFENHPERTPGDMLALIGDAPARVGTTVDTGWWGTQGYDAARAIEALHPRQLRAWQQTAWRAIRHGGVGTVRVVFAEVDWGRIETWHPAPVPFYEVGSLVDVAVYPLSIVAAMLGPARRVRAFGHVVQPDRVTKDGTPYRVTTPDLQIVVLELEGGVIVRLTASLWVGQQSKGLAGLQFHGDRGSLWLDSFFRFDAPVEVAGFGQLEPYVPLPPVRVASSEIDWARAVHDLAQAITDDGAYRATGDQAAHVIDILDAAERSMRADGAPIDVTSSFPLPAPMPWAEQGD